jgi:molybdopterin biosynthesis enzyme
VVQGQDIGATRAIPLLIRKTRVEKAVRICGRSLGVLRVLLLKCVKVGVLITGTEVYEGRIPDQFEPIIRRKVESLGGRIMGVLFLPDDEDRIAKEALDLVTQGADIIITTGGMSVDPDDRTRFALKKAGAKEMLYGSPVLPGAMFMVTYLNGIPVLGIPACGLFGKATVFDLIYPRILVGERISRQDLAKLGHGGYCLHCEACRYPDCSFGKAT